MTPAGWGQTLNQLQEALNQTSAEVDRQEAALTSPLLAEDADLGKYVRWQQRLEEASERLRECQARVEQAGRHAEATERELAKEEELLRQFHEQLEELRQKLANTPAAVIE
ncbi:MAG TPA: hypothetical protein VGZ47_00370 [Gemmataceae bacterium]|jgi:uncharacterized protein YukE|nr:hypothetical protein [Gemmataceae bacterium]